MTSIVAFTNRMDFKTLLDIECKGVTGIAPIIKEQEEDFHSFLNLLTEIDILILDQCSEQMLKAIDEKNESIKYKLILTAEPPTFNWKNLFCSENVQTIIDHLKTLVTPLSGKESGYISIPIETLVHFRILPIDLYIKLSEEKYLKRIPANEDIDDATIKAFKDKGIKEMHFEKKHNRDFSLLLINNMINKVESDYSSDIDKARATNEVFLTTKDIIQSVGLPAKVIQVCESVMDRITTDVVKSKDKFSHYLSTMQSDLDIQYRFVELTSFIATQIVDLSDAPNKEEQIKTIIFAAFFCDISLKTSGHIEFRSQEDMKDLWLQTQQEIQQHPLKAAEIVSRYKNAPKGAADIIKQHHGSADGKGFPKKIDPTIHPLAKVLLASQELSMAIIKNPGRPVPDVVADVMKKHSGGQIFELLMLFDLSCKNNMNV